MSTPGSSRISSTDFSQVVDAKDGINLGLVGSSDDVLGSKRLDRNEAVLASDIARQVLGVIAVEMGLR